MASAVVMVAVAVAVAVPAAGGKQKNVNQELILDLRFIFLLKIKFSHKVLQRKLLLMLPDLKLTFPLAIQMHHTPMVFLYKLS